MSHTYTSTGWLVFRCFFPILTENGIFRHQMELRVKSNICKPSCASKAIASQAKFIFHYRHPCRGQLDFNFSGISSVSKAKEFYDPARCCSFKRNRGWIEDLSGRHVPSLEYSKVMVNNKKNLRCFVFFSCSVTHIIGVQKTM